MTRMRLLTAGTWLGVAALVVLAARTLAYALAPSNTVLLGSSAEPVELRATLQHAAGGPRLVAVALGALMLGAGAAAAVVWLASVGVRERAALARLHAPRVRPLGVAAHAFALTLVTWGAFAALESYLHLRAGLPWHGLGCLTGPVHVAAMPILAGLSALAAAALAAAGHVLRWMRRTLRLLLERPQRLGTPVPLLAPIVEFVASPEFRRAAARPRAPPLTAG